MGVGNNDDEVRLQRFASKVVTERMWRLIIASAPRAISTSLYTFFLSRLNPSQGQSPFVSNTHPNSHVPPSIPIPSFQSVTANPKKECARTSIASPKCPIRASNRPCCHRIAHWGPYAQVTSGPDFRFLGHLHHCIIMATLADLHLENGNGRRIPSWSRSGINHRRRANERLPSPLTTVVVPPH